MVKKVVNGHGTAMQAVRNAERLGTFEPERNYALVKNVNVSKLKVALLIDRPRSGRADPKVNVIIKNCLLGQAAAGLILGPSAD